MRLFIILLLLHNFDCHTIIHIRKKCCIWFFEIAKSLVFHIILMNLTKPIIGVFLNILLWCLFKLLLEEIQLHSGICALFYLLPLSNVEWQIIFTTTIIEIDFHYNFILFIFILLKLDNTLWWVFLIALFF